MLKLKPPIGEKYHGLFESHSHNLAAKSIYRGFSPVNVYTDADASWIVTRVNHRILVAGDYGSSEAIQAVQQVVNEGVDAGKRGFVIYYPSGAKETSIGERIQGVKPYPNQRNYYRLDLPETPYPVNLPDDYRIEQATEDFIKKGYTNTELVTEEMQSERLSVSDFIAKSFAFCAVKDDFIAAWCMSEYNTDGGFEIGIETHTDHRKKGLALATSKACFNHGIKQGYKYVGWHCWKRNEASNRTALRLGFRHVLEYSVEYIEVE